jgi:hypothetical protein
VIIPSKVQANQYRFRLGATSPGISWRRRKNTRKPRIASERAEAVSSLQLLVTLGSTLLELTLYFATILKLSPRSGLQCISSSTFQNLDFSTAPLVSCLCPGYAAAQPAQVIGPGTSPLGPAPQDDVLYLPLPASRP